VHEVEEAISLNDKEIEDPVEPSLAFVLPAQEDKDMVIFSRIVGFIKGPWDLFYDHIYIFI
jgi:hypothetical protein